MQEDCAFDADCFGKNLTFLASKLSTRGQFIFCLWSVCVTFSHNFKNITQNGQNHSIKRHTCTIALKRRDVFPPFVLNNFANQLKIDINCAKPISLIFLMEYFLFYCRI